MIPIMMLIFVIVLMILFVAVSFLQKRNDLSKDELNLYGEELQTIKKNEES